jgi:magnesium transporter
MPELKWRWGYPVALSVIAAVSLLLFQRFRKAGWL